MDDEQHSRAPQATDRSWFAAQRWQQYDGELRANVLRILCLAVFFAIHLVHYYRPLPQLELGPRPEAIYHQGVVAMVLAWVTVAFAVFLLLRQRYFPSWMPYATTSVDISLLTALLCLGRGHESPLVLTFPLILVVAALRFNLTLIRAATAGCLFAYLFVGAAARWPELLGGRQIGQIPRYAQLITFAAIGIAGLMLGQMIRRIQTIALWYAKRAEQGGSDD